jgi:lipoprotein-anchoring transpeptidase ErfK/SrfK
MRFRSVILAAGLAVAVTPSFAREMVQLSGYPAGTIVVKTHERKLYLATEDGHAIRNPVGVGRAGMTWTGEGVINGKFIRPAWSPPDMIKQENPRIPDVILGVSASNPMGAAAMTLSVDQYATHGTNSPDSGGEVHLARLHPHVQRGRHGPLPARRRGNARGCLALKSRRSLSRTRDAR